VIALATAVGYRTNPLVRATAASGAASPGSNDSYVPATSKQDG
jgi:hypothetical protein